MRQAYVIMSTWLKPPWASLKSFQQRHGAKDCGEREGGDGGGGKEGTGRDSGGTFFVRELECMETLEERHLFRLK